MQYFIKKLKYYWNIWTTLIKFSLKKSRLYKTEIYSRLLRSVMIVSIQALVVESLFLQTDFVAGWSRPQYYLLIGSYNIVNYLGWAMFNTNLMRIPEKIVKGELDYALTKPTGSLFEIAFGEFFVDDLVPIISGFLLVGGYLLTQQFSGAGAFALYLVAILIGLATWFAIYLFTASLGFIFIGGNFLDILKAFSSSASAPSSIWGKFEIIMYTIFPIGLVASVPARVLSQDIEYWLLVPIFVVMLLTLYGSISFWNYVIRRYESGG